MKENFRSKLKEYLRSVSARSRDADKTALNAGLELISLKDIRNWFAHCCYCDRNQEVPIVASEIA